MLDIEQIRMILPHRYPMLLVDRIIEIEPKKRALGLKNVSINEEYFNGHFPGQAMMPGVLILEAMAQVGGVLILSIPNMDQKLAVIAGMDDVRFRRPVVPGDALITEATMMWLRRGFGKAKLVGRVENEVVAECDILFAIVDRQVTTLPTIDAENGVI